MFHRKKESQSEWWWIYLSELSLYECDVLWTQKLQSWIFFIYKYIRNEIWKWTGSSYCRFNFVDLYTVFYWKLIVL